MRAIKIATLSIVVVFASNILSTTVQRVDGSRTTKTDFVDLYTNNDNNNNNKHHNRHHQNNDDIFDNDNEPIGAMIRHRTHHEHRKRQTSQAQYQHPQHHTQRQQQQQKHHEQNESLHHHSRRSLYISPIGNVTSSVGRSAQLTCTVNGLAHGSAPYAVAWLKTDADRTEGTVLTMGVLPLVNEDEGKYRVTQQDGRHWTLHIARVTVQDRGRYMCQVNAANIKPVVGFLDVFEPPVINEELTSSETIVDELKRASLRCVSSGHPAPNVTWRRETGAQISLGFYGGKKMTSAVSEGDFLNISQVTRDDMGAYLCIASNGIPPSVSKRIVLQVNFAPKIRVMKQVYKTYVGTDVEFECRIEAWPTPEFYWVKGENERVDETLKKIEQQGTPISAESNDILPRYRRPNMHRKKFHFETISEGTYSSISRLTIRRLERTDFDSYKCVAKNHLGEKEGLIRLFETAIPTLPPTTTTTTTTTTTRRPTHSTESIDSSIKRPPHHRKSGELYNNNNGRSLREQNSNNYDEPDEEEDFSYLEKFYPKTRSRKNNSSFSLHSSLWWRILQILVVIGITILTLT